MGKCQGKQLRCSSSKEGMRGGDETVVVRKSKVHTPPAEKNIHFHMSSFNESVALGCLKQYAVEFVKLVPLVFMVVVVEVVACGSSR